MKVARLAIVSLFIAGVAIGIWLYAFSDAGVGPLDLVDDVAPTIRVGPTGVPILDRAPQTSVGRARDRVASSVRFRFLDATDNNPIAGGRVYRANDGVILGTTGPDGFVSVDGVGINSAVFGTTGYLVEHFFTRPKRVLELAEAATRDGFVTIALRRDEWSAQCRLQFVAADGSTARDVEFRILCLDDPCPDGSSVPNPGRAAREAISTDVRGAWARHVLLSTCPRPDFNPDFLHFGRSSHEVTYRSKGVADLRFISAGAHRVEVRSGNEFARETFDVGALPSEVTIRLRAGEPVLGQVLRARDDSPVVGASVILREGETVVTGERTDVQGRFRLGPMERSTFAMEIRHPGFQPMQIDVQPGPLETVYKLEELANHTVRGVVRRRPGLTPVPGAAVKLRIGEVVAETRTDAGGSFEVRSSAIEPMVEIHADGFLVYQELLNANGEDRHFDLIPADPEHRRRDGLTGILSGTVVDERGNPVAGRTVQAKAAAKAQGGGRPEFDRILKGGRLPMTRQVVTGSKGEFEIEWARAEDVRLVFSESSGSSEEGQVFTVVLGQRRRVELRDLAQPVWKRKGEVQRKAERR